MVQLSLPLPPPVNFPCVAGKYRPRREGEPPYVVGNDLALQDANRVAYRAVYENHMITNPEAMVRGRPRPAATPRHAMARAHTSVRQRRASWVL